MARVVKYFRDKNGYYCFHTKEGNLIKCLSLQGVKIQLHNFKTNIMSYLDTRDLEEKRNDLKQEILDNWNEKFEDNQLEDYEDIPLNSGVEEEDDFINYWKSEREEIEDINQVENEVGSEFSYGCTLIYEDDFEDYAQELVEDIGDLPSNLPSYISNNIDWSGVADDLRQDYSEVDYQGRTYLFIA